MDDPDRYFTAAGVARDHESDSRVTDVAGAETERGVDEIDLALFASAVPEQDDPRVGVWSSSPAIRTEPPSRAAAWRAARALPSKSMSLLVSGRNPGIRSATPRIRTQYATACPPTSTTERSAVRGPSCTRTRSTSSLDSGVAAATTSAQRPRCAEIHPGPRRKAGEHLVLLTQLRPSLLTRRERPRVLRARPLLLSGACNLVQPGFLSAGHPRPCYRRWERRSPGSSNRRRQPLPRRRSVTTGHGRDRSALDQLVHRLRSHYEIV
jgi:hypothetical protein